MDRTIMTKAELGELTTAEKEKIWDILIAGEAEVIEKNGKAVVWVTSKTGEDILLGLHKSGKADIKTRFPERFMADGSELTKENIKNADLTKLITAEEASKLKERAELLVMLNGMTVSELKAYAVENNIKLKATKKADIINELMG